MTVFRILDGFYEPADRLIGFLFYYERERRFFAEILSDVDEWNAPFMFSTCVRRGIYSIGSDLAYKFVCQRIVPPDRQNLGSILRTHRLKEYDEYKLLLLSEGRCSQDDLYLERIREEELPDEITKRLMKKVLDVIPEDGGEVYIFFRDGHAGRCDLMPLIGDRREFGRILQERDVFERVRVSPGGNGIEWGSEHCISAEELYEHVTASGLTYDDLMKFVRLRVADTTESADMLGCSRQYIGQLVREGRLVPVKSGSNTNLYLKGRLETC